VCWFVEMANATAFIDQNLAAQLFVAARAHDSLRQEPETLLPAAITEIFRIPTSNSHRVFISISASPHPWLLSIGQPLTVP
jgi:hypothetical protein